MPAWKVAQTISTFLFEPNPDARYFLLNVRNYAVIHVKTSRRILTVSVSGLFAQYASLAPLVFIHTVSLFRPSWIALTLTQFLSFSHRCSCNGHASACYLDSNSVLACRCKHNTAGRDCERCAPMFNDRPWRRATRDDAGECVGKQIAAGQLECDEKAATVTKFAEPQATNQSCRVWNDSISSRLALRFCATNAKSCFIGGKTTETIKLVRRSVELLSD